jgi:hypothetical protein
LLRGNQDDFFQVGARATVNMLISKAHKWKKFGRTRKAPLDGDRWLRGPAKCLFSILFETCGERYLKVCSK